jgi:hypothetical protein
VVTIEHRIEASHHSQKEIEQLGFDSDELLLFIPPRTSPQGDPRGLSANHGILDLDGVFVDDIPDVIKITSCSSGGTSFSRPIHECGQLFRSRL